MSKILYINAFVKNILLLFFRKTLKCQNNTSSDFEKKSKDRDNSITMISCEVKHFHQLKCDIRRGHYNEI